MTIKIMIADDNEALVQAFTRALNCEPDLDVITSTTDASQIIDLVTKTHPDIIILDINFPGSSGITIAREISKLEAPPRILAHSDYCDYDHISGMLEAGATGFVAKGSGLDTLITAVHSTNLGERVVPQDF